MNAVDTVEIRVHPLNLTRVLNEARERLSARPISGRSTTYQSSPIPTSMWTGRMRSRMAAANSGAETRCRYSRWRG